MPHPWTTALAVALLTTISEASAQSPPNRSGGRGAVIMFELADRDRDGRVTLPEAWAFIEAGFAAADRDRDRSLTMEEMASFRPDAPSSAETGRERPRPRGNAAWQEPVFRGLDANRDRRVQLDELRMPVEVLFRATDVNGDAALTRDEIPTGR